jgi:outer membrane immunogenic protein
MPSHKLCAAILGALLALLLVEGAPVSAADKGGAKVAGAIAAKPSDPAPGKPDFLPIPGAMVSSSTWGGLYLGAHAGYGWGGWDGSMIYTDATPYDGFDGDGKEIKSQGAIAGGQIGFNVQSGNVVWGLEGDAAWSDIKGARTLLPYPSSSGSPAWEFDTNIEWLATARARLGLAAGNALIYATGGAAFAEVNSSLDVVGEGYSAWGHKNEIKTGWTVGGGVEWMFAQNWTLKAEYLYINLGKVGGILPGEQTTSCETPCAHTTDGFRGDLDIHTVRIGINYLFGGK